MWRGGLWRDELYTGPVKEIFLERTYRIEKDTRENLGQEHHGKGNNWCRDLRKEPHDLKEQRVAGVSGV
jgi:hypothetical protein